MIGRGSCGNPWIFEQINATLTGSPYTPPSAKEVVNTLHAHIRGLHDLYGETTGVRIARKHLAWYVKCHFPDQSETLRARFNRLQHAEQQLKLIESLADETD
jgi:tRNA-dihydrouridine synthase B